MEFSTKLKDRKEEREKKKQKRKNKNTKSAVIVILVYVRLITNCVQIHNEYTNNTKIKRRRRSSNSKKDEKNIYRERQELQKRATKCSLQGNYLRDTRKKKQFFKYVEIVWMF